MALSADVSVFYWQWSLLQKAADAAALAGAHYLPGKPDVAATEAGNYAGFNGVSAGEITSIEFANGNTEITVTLTRTVPYYFARVLGLTEAPVTVVASAAVQNAEGARGIVPLGVNCRSGNPDDCGLVKGELHTLKMDQVGPGNWLPLDLGPTGGGAAAYKSDVINGCDCYVSLGDWLPTEPGNMVGPTRQAFRALLDAAAANSAFASSTYDSPMPGDPRLIEVPLADFTDVQGKMQVQVTGFAQFWLESADSRGNVVGRFLSVVDAEDYPDADAPAGGSLVPVLIR
ncbi:MAG: TadG family pilus assembly protein [Candidatus Binataceae bacterium]